MNRRINDISDPEDKTCEWLSKHPNYLEWFNRRHGLLWIKGKPGAGKSTLVRHVLATDERASHKIVFASFFFHARGSVLQKSPLGLFRSLLHQILQQVPELLLKFSSIFQKRCETQGKIGEKWHWHERDLEDFFKIHVAGAAKTYKMRIYVDALDECGKAAASNLVGFFTRLMKEVAFTNASLSICFSCRHYPDVALGNGLEVCIEDENHDDIQLYIQNTIENAVQDKETAEVIRDEVVRRSSGNFQWTVLVLPEVVDLDRNGYPLETIKRRIQAIPSELEELYQELLKGILDEDLPHSLRLMQWICFALRPLSLEELRFATIVDANTPYQSISDCQNAEECGYAKTDEQMKKRIRHLSRGLAEAKQHENIWIAQFVHQSVKDYLIQSGLQILDKHLSENAVGRAHFQLSRSCIRYIAMKEISNQTRPYGQNLKLDFPLLQYAITSWVSHAKEVEKKNMCQEDLLAFFYPASKLLQLWIHIYQEIERSSVECPFSSAMLLHVASGYCLPSVVSAILNLDNVEADLKDAEDRTPLSWAAAYGHETIVKLLIERDDVDINSKIDNGQTPLSLAAEYEHETIVKMLIERDDVDMNSKNYDGWTSLSLAAAFGHETIVKLLIERDDVETDSKDRYGQTPLSWAAGHGHETIVKLLIERDDVETDSKDRYGQTPLSWAAGHGHETIVKLLIERDDVEINSKDYNGQTPLSLAAEYEHKTIVKMLIERDVEINSKNYRGQTPLSLAAEREHETIVKLLIERDDVEINSRDHDGRTPLHWAARCEQKAVVKLLIERDDVEINSKDYNGQTPLSLAAEYEHETIVKMLIERDDVDMNSKNYDGWTSLSLAAAFGHETIVKMLIERDDVEINSEDCYGWTPLSWAILNEQKAVVKLLQLASKV
jgi:ankyrin repeat protein